MHQIKSEIIKLSTEQRYALIFNLLESETLDFTRIAATYVEFLRASRVAAKCKESEFAAMLSISWNKFPTLEANQFARARSSLLLENWVPDAILLKILKDVPLDIVEREHRYLERQNIGISDRVVKLKAGETNGNEK